MVIDTAGNVQAQASYPTRSKMSTLKVVRLPRSNSSTYITQLQVLEHVKIEISPCDVTQEQLRKDNGELATSFLQFWFVVHTS